MTTAKKEREKEREGKKGEQAVKGRQMGLSVMYIMTHLPVTASWECGIIKTEKWKVGIKVKKKHIEQSKLSGRKQCNKDFLGAYKSKFQKKFTETGLSSCAVTGCGVEVLGIERMIGSTPRYERE